MLSTFNKLNEEFPNFFPTERFLSKFKEEIKIIENYYKDTKFNDLRLLGKIYIFMYGEDKAICPVCGKIKNMKTLKKGFPKYCGICGLSQGSKNPNRKRKKEMVTEKRICPCCGKEFETIYSKNNSTDLPTKFCSRSCLFKYNWVSKSKEELKEIEKKRQATNLEKYGNVYVVNSEYTRQKTIEKLGVDYSFKMPEVLQKCEDTQKERYGDFYSKTPEAREKSRNTVLEKYGSFFNMTHRYKDYTMPSGKVIKVQGYEDIALDILLKTYKEEDIECGQPILKITGDIFYTDIDGNKHMYIPDI